MRIVKSKQLISFFFISQVLFWLIIHSFLIEKSFTLAEEERVLAQMIEENSLLEKEAVQLSSLTAIKEKAETSGLTPIKRIISLNWNKFVAFQP